MQYRELIANVARELPFPTEDGPKRALEATLTALFEAVPGHTARAVLAAFPGAPAALASTDTASGATTQTQLGARVARLLGEPESRAREQAQVVCAVLDRALSGDDRAALLRTLPRALTGLFDHPPVPNEAGLEVGHGHTLADGSPGSSHPLSDFGPGSRQPLSAARPARGHEHSVAEANPHGDSKLSSSRGMTQEREHESLGDGRSKR